MPDQDDASPEKAAALSTYEAEHQRLMHERDKAGSDAAAPHLAKRHHRTAAEVLAAATAEIAAGAHPADTLQGAHQAVREIARGKDLGVIAAGHARRQAHHLTAEAQRNRGELTPGSRMAAERQAAADAAFKLATDRGLTEAQAQAHADEAAEAVAAQQDARGGPLDQEAK